MSGGLNDPFGRTSDDVANDAVMMRGARSLVLIVEGPSDESALTMHLNSDKVGIVISGGKEAALGASRLLDSLPWDLSIRVLVDRDDDGERGHGPRAFATWARDLDTELLIAGGVLERVYLTLVGSRFNDREDDLTSVVASASAPLAALVNVGPVLAPGLKVVGMRLSGQRRTHPLDARVRAVVRQSLTKSGEVLVAEGRLCEAVLAEAEALTESLVGHHGHSVHEAMSAIVVRKGKAEAVQHAVWGCIYPSELRATSIGKEITSWGKALGIEIWAPEASDAA